MILRNRNLVLTETPLYHGDGSSNLTGSFNDGYDSISPNIQQQEMEDLNWSQQEKRNLVSNDGTFPWVFVLSDTACTVDIAMTGFGLRDASNFVVSGEIDGSTASACAPLITTSQSPLPGTLVNFISSQTTAGLVQWYKSFQAASSTIKALTISTNNVLIVYSDFSLASNMRLRVVKLSISTGAWVSEMYIESDPTKLAMTPSGYDNFGLFRSQITSSSARNYFSFEIYESTTEFATGLYKFDESFGVKWSRLINFGVNTHSMAILDMDFGSSYSVAVSYADTVGSTADLYVLTVLNETTGETLAELSIDNDYDQANYATDGCVRLIGDTWYLAIHSVAVDPASTLSGSYAYDTVNLITGALTVGTGTVTTAAPTAYKTPGLALISPQLEVVTLSSVNYLYFTAIEVPDFSLSQNTLESEIMHVYQLSTSLVVLKHHFLQKGQGTYGHATKSPLLLMRYFPATKNSALYLAYNIPQYLNPSYPNRITYFKINPANEVFGLESEASPVAFATGVSLVATVKTALAPFFVNYNNTGATYGAFTETPSVRSLTVDTTDGISVYDSTTSLTLITFKPDTNISPRAFTTSITTGAGATSGNGFNVMTSIDDVSKILSKDTTSATLATGFFEITVKDCLTDSAAVDSYTCTDLRYPNNTALNLAVTSKMTLKADLSPTYGAQAIIKTESNSFVREYIGSRTLELLCTHETTDIIQPYVRYNIDPLAADALAHGTDFTDPTQCETPVFPIFYGKDSQVTLNFIGPDLTGDDMLIAGAAKSRPFAPLNSAYARGFVGVIDSLGQPNWIYYIEDETSTNKDSNCFYASQSQTSGLNDIADYTIFAVCRAWNHEAQDQVGVVVGLSKTLGIVQFAKFLPRDYLSTGSEVYPFFVQQSDSLTQPLIIGQMYRYMVGTTEMNTFSILNVELDRTKVFYTYITDCAEDVDDVILGVSMIYDSNTDYVYALVHSQEEIIYSFDTTIANNQYYGGIRDKYTLPSAVAGPTPYNNDNVAMFDDTMGLLLAPYVNQDTDTLYLYVFDFLLSFVDGVVIPFANLEIYSASFAYMANNAATNQRHVLVSAQGAFVYISLSYDFNTVYAYKVWEYNTGGSYQMTGTFILESQSIIFGATGRWSTSDTHDSSIIFRIQEQDTDTDNSNINDYSCVAFREVFPGEQSDLYDYDYATTASAGTYLAGNTIFIGNGYDWAIYRDTEFMNEADGVAFKTFTYSSPYDWGFDLIPGHYDFRFPTLKQQCGAYVRQNDYTVPEFVQIHTAYGDYTGGSGAYTAGTLTEGVIFDQHYIEMTLGKAAYLKISEADLTCQSSRPIDVKVFTAGNTSQTIEQTWITYDSTTGVLSINSSSTLAGAAAYDDPTSRRLMQDDMDVAEPGTYALIIRYQDRYDADTYFDHPLSIRVLPVADHPDYTLDNYECYQNPYPTSFGGCSDSESSTNCKTYVENFIFDVELVGSTYRTQIYIAGSLQQDVDFMQYPYLNTDDAYLMKLNDVAIPIWFTTFSLSRTTTEAITALTKISDYIYCFMQTGDYYNAFLKVDATNGILLESKSINFYNANSGAFYIGSLRNMIATPSAISSTDFMATFTYSSDRENSENIATIQISDATPANTLSEWTIVDMMSFMEVDDYEFVAGTTLFPDTGATYYEGHLYQPSYMTDDDTIFRYLQLTGSATGSSFTDGEGYEIILEGDIQGQSVQPKLLFDEDYNVYAAMFTDEFCYIMKNNVTAAIPLIQLYSFTSIGGTSIVDKIENFDLLYQGDSFIVVLKVNYIDTVVDILDGLYFFTLDRLSMAITSKIRYDSYNGAVSAGPIAFLETYNSGLYRDYFTYVRNVPKFGSTDTNEVLVSRKAVMYSDDNMYDCRPSSVLAASTLDIGLHQTTYSAAVTGIDTVFTLFDWIAYLDNTALPFIIFNRIALQTFAVVTIQNTPYVSSVYMTDSELPKMFPQQEQQNTGNYYAGADSDQCSKGTGVQPPNTIDLAPIIAVLGDAEDSKIIYGNTFKQCQDLDVEYEFLYEDGTAIQTAENSFVTFEDGEIVYDLDNFQPAPGFRLLQFKANTEDDSREVYVAQPVIIRPKNYATEPLAPSADFEYTCISENDFPKIIGDLDNDFNQYGADVDQANGNTVICGSTSSGAYPNSFFTTEYDTALNLMSNLEGTIYWAYTASFIKGANQNYEADMVYTQCAITDDQLYVYSLLVVDKGASSITNDIVIVKQEYGYGQYVYSKKIPGDYIGIQSGFVLINLDDNDDGTADNLYTYIFGVRSDITTTHNHFSKFNLETEYPYQVWNAYSKISSVTITSQLTDTVGISSMGASEDAVFALSHFQADSLVSYANIAKYDAVSGEQMESISFVADLSDPSLSFVVDYENDLIYLSAATFVSTSAGVAHTYKRFIRRFDLDLVPDDSVTFNVLVSTDSVALAANVNFISDLTYNDTHIFETFSFEPSTFYMMSYLRQTLDILAYKRFYQKDLVIANLLIRPFVNGDDTWILQFQTSKGYLTTGFYSSVVSKFTYDAEIVDPNTCIETYYTDLLSTLGNAIGVVDITGPAAIESVFTYYYTPSYFNLQPQLQVYWEQKLYPEQISFQPARVFDCSSPGLNFPEALEHQIIDLPMNLNEDRIYSFLLPDVCNIDALTVTMEVEKYDSVPSFITGSKVETWEGIFYRIVFDKSITDSDANTYNIKVTLTKSGVSVSDSFILHIYPIEKYGSTIESFECEDKYNFMSFGGQVGNIYNHVDLDLETGDYILCGANSIKNNDNTGYYSSFIQSITQGHAVEWHLTLEAGEYDNIAQYCGLTDEIEDLDSERIIVTVVNSENYYQQASVSSTGYNSSIYVFQHTSYARFVNAKQIHNIDNDDNEDILQAEGFYLDRATADIYINGIADGFSLSHNSQGFFIVKINAFLEIVFYSVFDFGKTPVGGEMVFDGTNLFSIFGYQSDLVESHRWGLVSMKAADGTVNQGSSSPLVVSLINGIQVTRNSTRKFYQQGLILDDAQTSLYSCLIYKASEVHDEVSITELDSSDLSALRNIEFSRGYLPLESCHIEFQSESDYLVMALGTFEYTHIFAFDVSGDEITNVTNLGLVYYHQRYIPFKIQFFERAYVNPTTFATTHDFTLFIRTNGFDLNEDQLFITKFSDVETPTWDEPCIVSEIQFNTTSTFQLSMNGPNGVKANELANWQTIDFAFKQVSLLTLESYYIGNPQMFTETIVLGDDAVYRANFLECSRYSNPNEPYETLHEDSPVDDLTEILTVQDDAYIIKFAPFTQCSYDDITHRVVYQDSYEIAPFMVFDDDLLTLTITANLNEYAGLYLLKYEAYVDGDDSFVSSIDFNITIDQNMPPYPIFNGFTEDSVLYQAHTLRWTVELDFDPEGDEAIFSAFVLDTSGVELIDPTWFSIVSNNATHMIIEAKDAPIVDEVNGDQYYINVTVSDAFNTDTPNVYQISLVVMTDSAPYLNSDISLTLGNFYVNVPFSFTLFSSDFSDNESDEPIFYCDILSTSNDTVWLVEQARDPTTNALTFSGTPPSNDNVGSYIFVCAVTDVYLPDINFYQFRMNILENLELVTRDVEKVTLVRTESYIWSDLLISCVDPENQEITRTIAIHDDTLDEDIAAIDYEVRGFAWDAETAYLSFEFNSVDQVGNYTITMNCNDGFFEYDSMVAFELEALDNQPPTAVLPIGNNWIFVGSQPSVITIDISGVFTDPEGDDLYLQVLQIDGTILDSTAMTGTIQDDELIITILSPIAQTIYSLQLRATDPELQQTSIPFEVEIKACHETCMTCSNGGDTDCLTCQPDYVFYQNQCLLECGFSTYLDEIEQECIDCPEGCLTCSGSSSSYQCSECLAGYYIFTNDDGSTGCYNVCPTGYKVDDDTQSCVAVGSPLYFECIAFIQNFTVTHPFVEDFSDMESDTHTCTGMQVDCPNADELDGDCSWERQLAIQCRETSDDKVMIRVATNSMPNHCMQPETLFPDANLIDFEVEFSKPAAEISKKNLNSQALVNAQMCTLDWTASENLEELYSHNAVQGDVEGIVGISTNGVPIHSGTSELLYDFFAPKGTGSDAKRVEVDLCLGSSEYKTFYHYYSFSPCVYTNSISSNEVATSCLSNSQCTKDYLKYANTNLPTAQRVTSIVGIARDGHMIVGPYKATGSLWQPCDVDACNGVTVNGKYVYASTLFFPYTVACWGPATKQSSFGAACSSNTNTCYAGESFSILLSFSSMLMLLVLALYMF